jgi:glutathione S-transferase
MSQNYVIYYWPIPFRANLIRCLLDYNGVDYTEGNVVDLIAMKEASATPETAALFMAPPLLYDKEYDFYVSQTAAIVQHLSRKLSFVPDNPVKYAIGEKIIGDCNDVLNEITR